MSPLKRRPHVLSIRLTPAEYKRVQKAKRKDENLSDTLRRLLLISIPA